MHKLIAFAATAMLAACTHTPPPPAVSAFATRVLALNQRTGLSTTTNLDGVRLLTARHVLPQALENGDSLRVGSRKIDLARGVYRAAIHQQDFAILSLGVGRPRHTIRTDWAVIAPHPPILSPATPPSFAPPPTIGTRVWVIGFPGELGGTEPNAQPMVFPATVVAPPPLNGHGTESADGKPIDLSGSYVIQLRHTHPDLSGLSGGPVLALNPDGSVSIVGIASQQASRTELFGLIVHRWVFVAPVPDQIDSLLQAPLPEPYDMLRLRRRTPTRSPAS